jgi:hypothetical protein
MGNRLILRALLVFAALIALTASRKHSARGNPTQSVLCGPSRGRRRLAWLANDGRG